MADSPAIQQDFSVFGADEDVNPLDARIADEVHLATIPEFVFTAHEANVGDWNLGLDG